MDENINPLSLYGPEIMRPGLDRMRLALADILPKFKKTKIIIIAGTNGKGETTLRLSEFLKDSNHFTWTSPHVQKVNERFRNHHGLISDDELKFLIQKCHKAVCASKWELSYYEFLFFVFCTWASHFNPEYLLLEVGLGGRLDAVNVFDADLVLLPSISRDHQEILGPRYDLILKEKLGTLRKGCKLIHYLETKYLSELSLKLSQSIGAKCVNLNDFYNLPSYEFSIRNALLAGAAYCHLLNKKFTPQDYLHAGEPLENRGENLHKNGHWILYGSHNVDGMRKLIHFLQSGTYNFKTTSFDSVLVAFSKRNHVDLVLMLRMLKRAKIGNITITSFNHPKALGTYEAELLSKQEGTYFVSSIEKYLHQATNSSGVLVTGSYYFLGEFKSVLCGQ